MTVALVSLDGDQPARVRTSSHPLDDDESPAPLDQAEPKTPARPVDDPVEEIRRTDAIIAELNPMGELAEILARRIARLALRLEALDRVQGGDETGEGETHRHLMDTLTALRELRCPDIVADRWDAVEPARLIRPEPRESNPSSPRRPPIALRITPREPSAVEASERRISLPERAEFKKIVDGKCIILPNRV